MAEIHSEDSLYKFLTNKRAKSPPKKTRMKCTAACVRTNKSDRCTGAADTASASLHCSDAVQKTYRPVPQHDRGSACIKTTADCSRSQCPRAGRYATSDNPQCTKTRSYRTNESQCTGAAEKYGATDNTQCTVTRNYRTNDVRCTGVGNYRSNDGQCTGVGNYRSNDGQCTGAANKNGATDNTQCTVTRNYRTNDVRCTGVGTGNCGINNDGFNGCCCTSAAPAATAATACLGGSNSKGCGSADTLISTACKWARVVADWTWDKTSYFLVAGVSFFLGMYTYDWCLCTCEETS